MFSLYNDHVLPRFWLDEHIYIVSIQRINQSEGALCLYFPECWGSTPNEFRTPQQSSQVLTTKRAMLDNEVVSNLMFVKENLDVLRKHYNTLTGNDKDALPLELTRIPLINVVDATNIDVGQDLFKQNMKF